MTEHEKICQQFAAAERRLRKAESDVYAAEQQAKSAHDECHQARKAAARALEELLDATKTHYAPVAEG